MHSDIRETPCEGRSSFEKVSSKHIFAESFKLITAESRFETKIVLMLKHSAMRLIAEVVSAYLQSFSDFLRVFHLSPTLLHFLEALALQLQHVLYIYTLLSKYIYHLHTIAYIHLYICIFMCICIFICANVPKTTTKF